MSLVENLVNQIATQGLDGISKPLGFDLEDNTFAKLLDKQLNSQNTEILSNYPGNMGIPAGLFIEPMEGVDFAETAQDQMEILGENKISKDEYINQPIEFKEIDLGDYFSNLLKTSSGSNNDFLNFAKKQASNAYNLFSKGFVDDIGDFVKDIASAQ